MAGLTDAMNCAGGSARLLDPSEDPAPVEVLPATRRPELLLVCEHAGRAIPRRLQDLGLTEPELSWHIAWDIGAEAVARAMAERLGCTLILQRYSRLVIDCNRPPLGGGSIPEVSDGVTVPGNLNLTAAERQARVDEIFAPYASACEAAIASPEVRAAYSIHSFTPSMGGAERLMDVGILHRAPCSEGTALAEALRVDAPNLKVVENEPYRIEDETDWFIPCCVEPRALPHALIEIRNDLIAAPPDALDWADWLAGRIATILDAACTPARRPSPA